METTTKNTTKSAKKTTKKSTKKAVGVVQEGEERPTVILDVHDPDTTVHQVLKDLKLALQACFPKSCMIYYASDEVPGSKDSRLNSFGEYGDKKLIDCIGTDLVHTDGHALDFCRNVFMNEILSLERKDINPVTAQLHDAVLDLAKGLGLDCTGIQYYLRRTAVSQLVDDCLEKGKSVDTIEDSMRQKPQYEIGQNLRKTDDLEAYLTILQKEEERVRQYMNPANRITLLNAEIKRLRRAGDLAMVAHKTIELNNILDEEKKRKETEIRKAENRKVALENLAKGRAIRTANIEKKKQAELDRQKGYKQFQPGRAAKKKMQKIAERQAERNARKKKGKEGDNFHAVRNACSLGHG